MEHVKKLQEKIERLEAAAKAADRQSMVADPFERGRATGEAIGIQSALRELYNLLGCFEAMAGVEVAS